MVWNSHSISNNWIIYNALKEFLWEIKLKMSTVKCQVEHRTPKKKDFKKPLEEIKLNKVKTYKIDASSSYSLNFNPLDYAFHF